jgi:magnesium transporter
MPAMADTGGNIGSQISALVIRGMALGEIEQKDWWRILLRELLIGAMLGIVLALTVVLRAVFVTRATQVILAVSTALFAVVVVSNIIGALLPFIAKSLKIDPAIMTGPLLTTIVDLLGIAMYFSIANFILSV